MAFSLLKISVVTESSFIFCLNNMSVSFLRWLQSVKWYWKQADNIIEQNMASKRGAGYRASFHKDFSQRKQSYKVRLGKFDTFVGVLFFILNCSSHCVFIHLEILALHF